MERGVAVLLALWLGLGAPRGRGQPLLVEPPGPEVAVALGASRPLACSLACAHGPAAVRWRGLDTGLGAVHTDAGRSVLWLRGAALSDAGTRVCEGSCGGRTFQRPVRVLVYAFPEQLAVSPTTLGPTRGQEVACTARNVTPAEPDTLTFSLLLGGRELEGVRALDWDREEEEPQGADEPLFRVTQRWRLPDLAALAPATLHCQATLRLPGLELSRRRALPASREPPTSSTASRDPVSTAHPASTSTEPPDTSSLQAAPQQASVPSPRSPGACRPEIRQAQGLARWGLLCAAACGAGVAVRWTLAPGGLEAYETREAGAQAWLSAALPAGSSPEGWFQCRLEPGGQVASLYIPGPKPLPTPETQLPAVLWSSSLVLGLPLLALLAYGLRRRCRPSAQDSTCPPTSLRLLPLWDSEGQPASPTAQMPGSEP
ncbi:mucosal addressin cell adhesion molecule 1 [Ctenodactylus gundi]